MLERKNDILMGKAPNLVQLPLMVNLMTLQKSQSFIDKRTCLNSNCNSQFSHHTPNYWSENKLVLHKSDSVKASLCSKCNNQRNCAIYECKYCESKACYYCLVETSK